MNALSSESDLLDRLEQQGGLAPALFPNVN